MSRILTLTSPIAWTMGMAIPIGSRATTSAVRGRECAATRTAAERSDATGVGSRAANVASGFIQRIVPDAALTAALDAAASGGKAAIYGRNSIWYDALEALSDQINAAQQDKTLRRLRAGLLAQAGLKAAAEADRR